MTTAARTLADLKPAMPPTRFEELLRRAEGLRLDLGPFADPDDPAGTALERRMLALCRRHRFPRPLMQQIIGPYTVDFHWPHAQLIVETDGWSSHGSRSSFERDRERDAWLVARGFRVVRFTWRQLRDDPATVVRTLRRLLGRGA